MNITDLMVGDLVSYLDDDKLVIVVVKKIDGKDNIVCVRQKDGHVFNTMIEFLIPIPITAKILEHNGFEKEEESYYHNFKDEEFNLVYWLKDYYLEAQNLKNESGADLHCHHVHQLQHTLKVCSIRKEITLP